MWPFSAKRRLIRQLDHLAFYNDKGVAYARHTPDQAEEERRAKLETIRKLVAEVGEQAFPTEFIDALRSGKLAHDGTGKYVDMARKR
jgi:hypothetical protein